MKKPHSPTTAVPPLVAPTNWNTSDRLALAAVHGLMIHQSTAPQGIREVVRKAVPCATPAEANYVDPYLFEVGYYASRAEYEELMARPTSTTQLHENVENTPKKKHSSRSAT
jgi:hypothetical protein